MNDDERKELLSVIEREINQRIVGLEARVEKHVEDFFLKKFDSTQKRPEKTSGGIKDPEIKEHIKEVMDIQEEIISKMHGNKGSDTSAIENRLEELGSAVSENTRDIKNIISRLEGIKARCFSKKGGSQAEDFDEKFFDLNRRIEQVRADLLGEISRIENRPLPAPPTREPARPEKDDRMENKILDLESELMKMRKKKNAAVILE